MEDPILPGVFLCKGPERHSWVDADDAAKCCNGYTRERRVCRDADGTLKLEFYWHLATDDEAPPPATPIETSRLVLPPPLDLVEDEPRRAAAPATPATAAAASPSGGVGLTHGAFFRRVAEITDEDSPTWRALTAGLLTLRLVDRWAARHTTGRDPTFKEYVLVRRAINEVDDDRVHDVLRQLTDTLRDFSTGEAGSVPKLLFAYGLFLEDGAEWPLAIDVYETVLQHARRPAERDGVALVYNRLGYCLRQLGELESAAGVYDRGRRIALAVGDVAGALRLRNAEANLVAHRGDYPQAIAIWNALIEEAQAGGHVDVFARASHDRGNAAYHLREFERAALFLFNAMQAYEDEAQRERAFMDLASTMRSLGVLEHARDAFYVLHRTAEQHEVRVAAGINLLQLAAEDGDMVAFDAQCRAIDPATVPVRLEAVFYESVADGYRAFDRPDQAEWYYRKLGAVAETRGMSEFASLAEQQLRELGSAARLSSSADRHPALTTVFRHVSERRMALASGA